MIEGVLNLAPQFLVNFIFLMWLNCMSLVIFAAKYLGQLVNFSKGGNLCLDANGGHFEHLLKVLLYYITVII
jgi:hypothetical protein